MIKRNNISYYIKILVLSKNLQNSQNISINKNMVQKPDNVVLNQQAVYYTCIGMNTRWAHILELSSSANLKTFFDRVVKEASKNYASV